MLGATLLHLLFLLTVGNGLVLAAALFARRKDFPPNTLLGIVVLCALYCDGVETLKSTGEIDSFPFFFRSTFPVALAGLSLLHLYVQSVTETGARAVHRNWAHALPAAFGVLWYLAFWVFPTSPDFWRISEAQAWEKYCRTCVTAGVCAFYLIASHRNVLALRRRMREEFSEFETVRLGWLHLVRFIFVVVAAITFTDVLTGPAIPVWRLVPPAQYQAHQARLTECLTRQKPFLNPQLRLADLARQLDLKPYQVSDLINRTLGMSFFDLINQCRVDEAKRRLTDPSGSHLNILGIANDSGFNSKSSFNEAFKKFTGVTPSTYQRQNRSGTT